MLLALIKAGIMHCSCLLCPSGNEADQGKIDEHMLAMD